MERHANGEKRRVEKRIALGLRAGGQARRISSPSFVLVVATRRYVLIITRKGLEMEHYASSDLTSAIQACGGSSALNGLPTYDGEKHRLPYLLVAMCDSDVRASNVGLELVGGSRARRFSARVDLGGLGALVNAVRHAWENLSITAAVANERQVVPAKRCFCCALSTV